MAVVLRWFPCSSRHLLLRGTAVRRAALNYFVARFCTPTNRRGSSATSLHDSTDALPAGSPFFVDLDKINTNPLMGAWNDRFNKRAQSKASRKPSKPNHTTSVSSSENNNGEVVRSASSAAPIMEEEMDKGGRDAEGAAAVTTGGKRNFDWCDLRRDTRLYNIPIYLVLRVLVDDCPALQFTRTGFLRSLQSLLAREGWDVCDETINNLFDAFDRNQNDVVDFIELLAGLAQVCQGTQEDRIRALFEVFDRERDDKLFFDEVMGVFCLIYRVVLSPSMIVDLKQAHVEFDTIDELALCSTQELFRRILYQREQSKIQPQPFASSPSFCQVPASSPTSYLFRECSNGEEDDKEFPRLDFIEQMLLSNEDSNSCSIDTVDLESNARWRGLSLGRISRPPRTVRLAEEKNTYHRLHPALQYHKDEGIGPWRVANSMRHLCLSYEEFKQACLRAPPAAGFSKSTLLLLPLIETLKEILAPPEPTLWNCPVNRSASRRAGSGGKATSVRGEGMQGSSIDPLVEGGRKDDKQRGRGGRTQAGEKSDYELNQEKREKKDTEKNGKNRRQIDDTTDHNGKNTSSSYNLSSFLGQSNRY